MTSPEFRMFTIRSLSIILTKMSKEWIAKYVKRYDLHYYYSLLLNKDHRKFDFEKATKIFSVIIKVNTLNYIKNIFYLETFTC